MVSVWTLVALLTTLQLVQPASLRNCSNPLEADHVNCEAVNLHQDDRAKPLHVGFDDMFHFVQPSPTDRHERRKRETEDLTETGAEIFSSGPGTSLNIQSLPMTTLDDTESNLDEKEFEESQDQDVSENVKHGEEVNTGVEEVEGEEERDEQEETTLDVENNIHDTEIAEQDSISDSLENKESEVVDLLADDVEGLSDSHTVPYMDYEEMKLKESDANEDVKVTAISEVESVSQPDVNEEHPKNTISNENDELSKNDQVEMIQSSAKSSVSSPMGQIIQSDDEDEDAVESGSGSGDDSITDLIYKPKHKTEDDQSRLSHPSSGNKISVDGDSDKIELEEEEENPISAPNQHSSVSSPSVDKTEHVESDNSFEGETLNTDRTPSISNNYSVESDNDEEDILKTDSSFITTTLNKSSDPLLDLDTSGSGDDTNDEENTLRVDIENPLDGSSAVVDIGGGAGNDSNQVAPIPTPIETSDEDNSDGNDNFNIETTDDEDNDDVSPISNPTLDEESELNPIVDNVIKIEEGLNTIMGVSNRSDADSKIPPIADIGEGSGNTSSDNSDEDSEEMPFFPPVIARGMNTLGSSSKGRGVNTEKEGPHVKGVIDELPNTIVASKDVSQIAGSVDDLSDKVVVGGPLVDEGAVKEPNSINEIGVKTDEKKPNPATGTTDTSTSSGSYIVLGAIMVTIIALLAYTVIKSKRQKQKKKDLRMKPKDEEAGTELKEIEQLLNRDKRNGNGTANGSGGERDGLLSSKGGENDEIPSSKITYPLERPNIPSNGFASLSQTPAGLSEVTVENVPKVFETVPIIANGGKRIPRVRESDSDSYDGSDDDSSDDRGTWVYGNVPLETTKIKTYIDHDSIPKTPIVIVKRNGAAVEM